MNRKNRYTGILLLMVISQVLLFVLVIQWLRSQYKNGKQFLTEEVNRIYLETQEEMVDTLLFRSYVSPVISGDSVINRHFIAMIDTPGMTSQHNPVDINQNIIWKGGRGTVTIRIDEEGDSASGMPDTIRLRRTNEDMLLRSVKMIVAHVSDSGRNKVSQPLRFNLRLDSSLFVMHFNEKMSDAGLEFNTTWNGNRHVQENISRNTIFLNPHNPFTLPVAEITGYSGYILNRILPQLIFGIFLVSITALAFFISYRNLRSHMIMNSLRNEFISNIAHELRTPVTTISVAVESLRKYNMSNDPAVAGKYLSLASIETGRLEELINRILDHSLLEEGHYPLNKVNTDINPLINEVVEMMRQKLENGGTISFVSREESLPVMCDHLFIRGAIINVVENSIRYCDKIPEIRIIAERKDGYVVIRINDNGPGIPGEYHRKVFEKFFRVPSGNIHNVKGYGLGLSFVSRVMKLHKGSAGVENLTPGCSFILKLPLV